MHQKGETVLEVRLEVFPSKLDYQKDYREILRDVNEQVHNLAFDFLRRTYQMTGLKETSSQSLTEFFSILRAIFDDLVRAVERIEKMPHHRLVREDRVTVADRVKRAGRDNVSYLAKRPHLLVQDDRHGVIEIAGQGYRPTHLIESRRRVDTDTVENRFLRWALLRIDAKLKRMKQHLLSGRKRWRRGDAEQQDRVARIERMQGHLARLLRADFLQGVGEMRQMSVTLVLQMAPGYREVYRLYLMLLKGLELQGDLFRLSLKDVAQLYEYWCFLKLHSLLAKKYRLVSQDLIRVDRGGLFVTLDQRKAAKVEYAHPRTGERFTLAFNPKMTGSPTVGQRPDHVLRLQKQDSDVAYSYVFDAKYRIDPAEAGSAYAEQYRGPGPQEGDINTMHRYRDAIVHAEDGDGAYARTMFGAYVLFPYGEEERYREHPFYRSIAKVNVGALPFLPGATTLVEAFLDELILDSPEKAFERTTLPAGSGAYFAEQLGGLDVLIGSVRSREQLAVSLERNFYHMPLKNVTKQEGLTELRRIGIYQHRDAFGKDAGIRYTGRIKSWTVVPRSLITEIPARSGTESLLYVRFEIEAWEERSRVIVPGGHGVQRCLLTSSYLLDRAGQVAELRLSEDAHVAIWREQRRKGRVRVTWDREHVDEAVRLVEIVGEG
ncbi:restriction endonuclease-like protein [Tumebacillus sp. DT12]|uniref:Restriction endonuclease-like protein n=1 Tax=Tumebacillus lacus TaxID=2995335 RepID=A0ABT3WWZ6_9BACL|nr:restriction endonuclease-like protein [Tumebacillus lacus]MCX7569190.1 restriction endonuclease-like protein [Tumebacillus lacus]